MISFTIKGDPKALKRHRSFRRGKFLGQYDPSQGEKEDFLSLAHSNAPEKPIDIQVKLKAMFIFSRPKNHYRSNGMVKSQFLDVAHTKKPDIDNLVKFIMDALNGVFWKDDSLIYRVDAYKIYGEMPYTQIEIEWNENHPIAGM